LIVQKRETKETQIEIKLEIYGSGKSNIDTGVGFFDHMLDAFTRHSLIDLEIKCKGDLFVDAHHTVEDVGIVLGKAINKAIYPLQGVERFGSGVAVMDESALECHLDLSNRAFLVYEVPIDGKVGDFDVELAEEFFRAVSFNAPFSMHLIFQRGKNRHHILEASFKAFALAFRRALNPNPRIKIPSTKEVL
jgi:imidazoleglycerol-phosphate dehydratase